MSKHLSKHLTLFFFSAILCAGSAAVQAQSAEIMTCNRAAQDARETCQKRIAPAAKPVDPNRPTATEQKSMDKHAKAWQSCNAKAEKRAAACGQ